jgi:maltooligosyltrehalose trehalohydrolase
MARDDRVATPGPATPMLFQGQEFAASSPLLFFADFDADLNEAVRKGRWEFLTQFPSVRDYISAGRLDDPAREATFERCKLDFSERETNRAGYQLHEDLLTLRREVPAFNTHRRGQELSSHAFVLRFLGDTPADDRLLIVNLGAELNRPSFANPLIAPPVATDWRLEWSSEDPKYGGSGTRGPLARRKVEHRTRGRSGVYTGSVTRTAKRLRAAAYSVTD